MRASRAIFWVVVLLQCAASNAQAQYIFIDANGDGINSSADRLVPKAANPIHIWLETNRNRDSSPAIDAVRDGIPISMFSYEFILHAVGGTVEWGAYANAVAGLPEMSATFSDPSYFYVGYRGPVPLPPGKYMLGSLTVQVKTGNPEIHFASSAPRWLGVLTSIGSMAPGKDRDHALCFTENPADIGAQSQDIPGDWSDADGVSGKIVVQGGVVGSPARSDLATFGARVTPNPMNPSATLTVTTTRPGVLRVRLYSPSGRLLRVLLDQATVPGGDYAIQISDHNSAHPLPSGVYYYRVEASEGTLTGHVVILK